MKESGLQIVTQHNIFSINKKKLCLWSTIIFFIVFNCGLFQLAVTLRPVLLGNERAHVRLLHSVVIKDSFEINPDKTDVSYYNGRYYSNKPPGFSFILIPAYRIYTWLSGNHSEGNAFLFVKVSNIIFSSLSAVVVFLFLLTFRLSGMNVFFGLIAAIFETIFPSGIIFGILSAFFFEKTGRSIRSIAFVLLLFPCFTGIMSLFIQIDESSLPLTWKAEPADVHANFYTELLYPLLKRSI